MEERVSEIPVFGIEQMIDGQTKYLEEDDTKEGNEPGVVVDEIVSSECRRDAAKRLRGG